MYTRAFFPGHHAAPGGLSWTATSWPGGARCSRVAQADDGFVGGQSAFYQVLESSMIGKGSDGICKLWRSPFAPDLAQPWSRRSVGSYAPIGTQQAKNGSNTTCPSRLSPPLKTATHIVFVLHHPQNPHCHSWQFISGAVSLHLRRNLTSRGVQNN